jgi:hypothetical protein
MGIFGRKKKNKGESEPPEPQWAEGQTPAPAEPETAVEAEVVENASTETAQSDEPVTETPANAE